MNKHGWWWAVSLSMLVMFLTTLLALTSLSLDNDISWGDILIILVASTSFSVMILATFDYLKILGKNPEKSNITSTESEFERTKKHYIGKEVIVFDYELHENIGDLADNEFYWKPGKIVKLHKVKGGYLVDVETKDGKILHECGTDYLRNWK